MNLTNAPTTIETPNRTVTVTNWEWEDSDTGFMEIRGKDEAGTEKVKRFFTINETDTEIKYDGQWISVEEDEGGWGITETFTPVTQVKRGGRWENVSEDDDEYTPMQGEDEIELEPDDYTWEPSTDNRIVVKGLRDEETIIRRTFEQIPQTMIKHRDGWVAAKEDSHDWGEKVMFRPDPVDAPVSTGGYDKAGDRVVVRYKDADSGQETAIAGHVERIYHIDERQISVDIAGDEILKANVTDKEVRRYKGPERGRKGHELIDISRLPPEDAKDGEMDPNNTSLSLADTARLLEGRAGELPFARDTDEAYEEFLSACGMYGDAVVRERTVNSQGRVSVGRPLAGEDVFIVCIPRK